MVLVLYGIVGALFSYCVSLVVTSPLAAFAMSAGYQVIMFVVSHGDHLEFKSWCVEAMSSCTSQRICSRSPMPRPLTRIQTWS